LIHLLVSSGSNVNAQDFAGRSPLHIACEKNHELSVRSLLLELSDPFKKDHEGREPCDVTKNKNLHSLLKRARLVNKKMILVTFSSLYGKYQTLRK
jgi:ankyrin repeat protein